MASQKDISHPAIDSNGHLSLEVSAGEAGSRVDRMLGRALAPHYSRSYLTALLVEGILTVDGKTVRPAFRVSTGTMIEGDLGEPTDALPGPEPMDLEIIHEDESIIIVNKPTDLIIHPGSGSRSGTLINGLLHRYPEVSVVGRAERPGIVHRLDKNTTGVMVVARTNEAARSLVNQFKAKTVEKTYVAIVWGEMPFDSDWIELQIGPHPAHPQLRAVVSDGGQTASTFYEVKERLGVASLVQVTPRSGRTHQIRVHLEHLGFPVIGDVQYGRLALESYRRWITHLPEPPVLGRQALHAQTLSFEHPVTGERVEYEAPLPSDMEDLIEKFRSAKE